MAKVARLAAVGDGDSVAEQANVEVEGEGERRRDSELARRVGQERLVAAEGEGRQGGEAPRR